MKYLTIQLFGRNPAVLSGSQLTAVGVVQDGVLCNSEEMSQRCELWFDAAYYGCH